MNIAHDELNPLADSLMIELSYVRHDPVVENEQVAANTVVHVIGPGIWRTHQGGVDEVLKQVIVQCRRELEKKGWMEA